MAADELLLSDGSSRLLLSDGASVLLLSTETASGTSRKIGIIGGGIAYTFVLLCTLLELTQWLTI